MISISVQNPQSLQKIRNKSIDGFTVSVVCRGATALSGVLIDAEQLQLKGTVKRNGQTTELFNTTLLNLIYLSHLERPSYEYIKGITSGVWLDAVNGSNILMPLRFDLGGPLNLVGDDEFTLEWQLNATSFFRSAANVSSSLSSIQIDECETTDVEYYTPISHVQVIEAGQTNPSYALGDNVTRVVFRNDDKTNYADGNNVINNVNITTRQGLSKNDNFYEVVTKNFNYYEVPNSAFLRYQNFVVYGGKDELDSCNITLNLNGTNVASSKNFILYRTFQTSNELVTRGTLLDAKKEASADRKGSYSQSLAGKTQI